MKKTILAVSSILLFTVIAFLACKKDNGNSITKTSSPNSMARYSSDYIPLDFTQVDIGQLHNTHVINAYANIDFSSSSLQDDLFSYFNNYDIDFDTLMTHDEFIEVLNTVHNNMENCGYDLRNETTSSLSDELKPYYFDVLNECDSIITLLDFNQRLDAILSAAENSLENEDYDKLKAGIIVAKSSAYLWAPTNMDGYGLYDQLLVNAEPYNVQMAARWKKVLIGDVSGLSGYFTVLGTSMAIWASLNPGTGAMILGGAALTAAWSSGTAALF